MLMFGQGRWPEHWTLRGDDRDILTALERKGMVTGDRYDARLTELGRELAAMMSSERHREIAERTVFRRRAALQARTAAR